MGYENFNQTSNSGSKQGNLNLCDIVEVCDTLKNDFTTYGPGLLKSAITDTQPRTVVAAGAAAALVTVGVVAEAPVLFGLAGAAGLTAAGLVVADTILPKVNPPAKNNQQ